jgi:hypothetical protein
VDSTGLRLCGPGEWLAEKHGTKRHRAWRMLRLATDADTGRIVASDLSDRDADDGSQVGPLLDQVDGMVATFTGDGAHDRDDGCGLPRGVAGPRQATAPGAGPAGAVTELIRNPDAMPLLIYARQRAML